MKWILFMTLITRFGISTDHVELGREDDCWRAASVWVASQNQRHSATAFCLAKHVDAPPAPARLK